MYVSVCVQTYTYTYRLTRMLSHFSHVWLFATQWTEPIQALCPQNSPGKNTGAVSVPSSRGSSRPRKWTHVSCDSCITGYLLKPYECICVYIYTHTHTYIHIYTHIHIHTYICTYIHTHIYTYMYVHIYTHTHTYIYIYIHTYIRRRQWHPTPVLWPGESHGWRSLVGCSPWGR